MLEVNISREQRKHGLRPGEFTAALQLTVLLKHICVRGLMYIAGLGTGGQETLGDFVAL